MITGTAQTPTRGEIWDYNSPTQELGVWLLALRSFLRAHNLPLTEAEARMLNERDFSREVQVARNCLLSIAHKTMRLLPDADFNEELFANTDDDESELTMFSLTEPALSASTEQQESLLSLTNALLETWSVCGSLATEPALGFQAWAGVGRLLERALSHSAAAQAAMQEASAITSAHLPKPLQPLLRRALVSPMFDADLHNVFIWLTRLRSRLGLIEAMLRHDHPLKQSLPLFTLLHEETRALLDYLQHRLLAYEGVNADIFDTLDGTSYALQMETRKVFAHELVGFSALRPAPAAYAKIETAHGLLLNSFQESTIILARLFEPDLEGATIFRDFQTRLQQSLILRSDLWRLLQLVQVAERERETFSATRLLEQLEEFRSHSLRFLMYKDLESCERFIEEVTLARGTVERTPVLHRFAAYLETLHGQVNMRTALAPHPFDYPALKEL